MKFEREKDCEFGEEGRDDVERWEGKGREGRMRRGGKGREGKGS